MKSITITMLDDILANIRQLVPEGECRRSYLPEIDVKKLEKLKKPLVSVILNDRDSVTETRGEMTDNTFLVDLVVQKKLSSFSNEEIDPLIVIVERLFNSFLSKIKFTANGRKYNCGNPIHGDDAPFFAANELLTRNCFLGMVQVEIKLREKNVCIGNENQDD